MYFPANPASLHSFLPCLLNQQRGILFIVPVKKYRLLFIRFITGIFGRGIGTLTVRVYRCGPLILLLLEVQRVPDTTQFHRLWLCENDVEINDMHVCLLPVHVYKVHKSRCNIMLHCTWILFLEQALSHLIFYCPRVCDIKLLTAAIVWGWCC